MRIDTDFFKKQISELDDELVRLNEEFSANAKFVTRSMLRSASSEVEESKKMVNELLGCVFQNVDERRFAQDKGVDLLKKTALSLAEFKILLARRKEAEKANTVNAPTSAVGSVPDRLQMQEPSPGAPSADSDRDSNRLYDEYKKIMPSLQSHFFKSVVYNLPDCISVAKIKIKSLDLNIFLSKIHDNFFLSNVLSDCSEDERRVVQEKIKELLPSILLELFAKNFHVFIEYRATTFFNDVLTARNTFFPGFSLLDKITDLALQFESAIVAYRQEKNNDILWDRCRATLQQYSGFLGKLDFSQFSLPDDFVAQKINEFFSPTYFLSDNDYYSESKRLIHTALFEHIGNFLLSYCHKVKLRIENAMIGVEALDSAILSEFDSLGIVKDDDARAQHAVLSHWVKGFQRTIDRAKILDDTAKIWVVSGISLAELMRLEMYCRASAKNLVLYFQCQSKNSRLSKDINTALVENVPALSEMDDFYANEKNRLTELLNKIQELLTNLFSALGDHDRFNALLNIFNLAVTGTQKKGDAFKNKYPSAVAVDEKIVSRPQLAPLILEGLPEMLDDECDTPRLAARVAWPGMWQQFASAASTQPQAGDADLSLSPPADAVTRPASPANVCPETDDSSEFVAKTWQSWHDYQAEYAEKMNAMVEWEERWKAEPVYIGDGEFQEHINSVFDVITAVEQQLNEINQLLCASGNYVSSSARSTITKTLSQIGTLLVYIEDVQTDADEALTALLQDAQEQVVGCGPAYAGPK